MKNYKFLNFRIPVELLVRLDESAAVVGVPKSSITKMALERYLRDLENERK